MTSEIERLSGSQQQHVVRHCDPTGKATTSRYLLHCVHLRRQHLRCQMKRLHVSLAAAEL